MSKFEIHTAGTAPEESRPLLERTQQTIGFVPNLIGGMAVSPALTEGYLQLAGSFEKTAFDATERQVILLTVSRHNECHYCVAAHTALAAMQQVPRAVLNAIRNDQPIPDERLEALRRFTSAVVQQRGWVDDDTVQAFLDAGFDRRQVADVILGVGLKTLSNYFNHVAGTELDEQFEVLAWTPPRPAA